MRIALSRAFVLLLCSAAPALAAPATSPPVWADVASLETVEVVTSDEDGSTRETTVWLAVLDGQGYVRTGNTHWGDNLERDPELLLRIGEHEYALAVELVEDDALRERVSAVFRQKYGFTDAAMSFLRGSHPRIMRLIARENP